MCKCVILEGFDCVWDCEVYCDSKMVCEILLYSEFSSAFLMKRGLMFFIHTGLPIPEHITGAPEKYSVYSVLIYSVLLNVIMSRLL